MYQNIIFVLIDNNMKRIQYGIGNKTFYNKVNYSFIKHTFFGNPFFQSKNCCKEFPKKHNMIGIYNPL